MMPKKKNRRYRLRFDFWLDMNRPEEEHLAKTIETLKENRQYAKTIRDGIRLICDLRQGKIDVLFELFPWAKAEFLAGVQPKETPTNQAIQAQLERIEAQLLQQGNTPIAAGNSNGGPKKMDVSTFRTPTFDDSGGDDLVLKKDTSTNAGKNFLQSMMNLQA